MKGFAGIQRLAYVERMACPRDWTAKSRPAARPLIAGQPPCIQRNQFTLDTVAKSAQFSKAWATARDLHSIFNDGSHLVLVVPRLGIKTASR
jgi:hypothetical protein